MMSSLFLRKLNSKDEVDAVIIDVEDKVVVLRFGRESDTVCMQLDDIVMQRNGPSWFFLVAESISFIS